MTDLTTEEMLDKAAEQIETDGYNLCSDPGCLPCRKMRRDVARAALTAALPLVVEECAKAASEACWKHVGDDAFTQGKDAGAIHQTRACVDAIRSLLPTATKEK